MERDLPSLAWRAAPFWNVAAFGALAAAFLLAFAGIDLLRFVVGGAGEAAPRLLQMRLDLPDALGGPLLLFPGLGAASADPGAAGSGPILVVALVLAAAAALLSWILRACESAIGRRGVVTLRTDLLEAITHSRPAARDEAREASRLAGERLGRLAEPIGGALTRPALAGGALGLAVISALAADWRLAILVAVLLAVLLKGIAIAIEAREAAFLARARAGQREEKALADLVRRLPAVEAHGTAGAETGRILTTVVELARPVAASERRAALRAGMAAFLIAALPAALLSAAAIFGFRGGLPANLGALAAALLAVPALAGLARQRRALAGATPLVDEIDRALTALRSRNRLAAAGASRADRGFPAAGPLVAESVSALDATSGVRVAGLDLSIVLPAHVAVTGDAGSGARVFAGLVAGRLRPSLGRLTFAGVDLYAVDPAMRAKHIGFAGGDPVLIAGSLRDNLLYGCLGAERAPAEERLQEALQITALDRAVHARGLTGTVDGARETDLAAALVETRRAIRTALAEKGLGNLVEPFDRERYNRHATIGENILFGVPRDGTFRPENLPAHPFLQAILEAEDLTRPLVQMGHAIAEGMVEIFADLPEGHPLYQRYAFFPGAERAAYEDLVERHGERRRGLEPGRDRERLIALALLYVEPRHRLGLLDEVLEERIVRARRAFAEMIPANFREAIEFYDPDRIAAAATLQDNLLFGRVTEERAGAEAAVLAVMRRVLKERGLDHEVVRIGLASPVDPLGDDFDPGERAAIDLVRCLVRRPDILVVERGLEHFSLEAQEAFVPRLRRALAGRSLVLVAPRLAEGFDEPPFDAVVRFDRGTGSLQRPGAAGAAPAAEQAHGGAVESAPGPEGPAVPDGNVPEPAGDPSDAASDRPEADSTRVVGPAGHEPAA